MAFSSYPAKGGIPSGNTAARPSSPAIGDTYYNGTLGMLEIWSGTSWAPCSSPAGIPSYTVVDAASTRAYTDGPALTYSITPSTNGGIPNGYQLIATTNVTSTIYSTTTQSATPTLSLGTDAANYGATFTATLNAYNGFGTSANATGTALAATTKPQAPTIGTASTSFTSSDITVTWTNGATGGKNLTAITITPYLNGVTAQTPRTAATTSSTSYTFTGATALTVGSSYTFKVKATNANGDSPESSATNSVTVPSVASVQYVILGGGAGGGGGESSNAGDGGGGGGAGGYITGTTDIAKLTTYTIEVGAGSSGTAGGLSSGNAANGTLSRIQSGGTTVGSLSALGGGGGGHNDGNGQNGGCGGGASGDSGTGGTGSQGGNGGVGASRAGGGGGGIGGNGQTSTTGGNGGIGLTEPIKSLSIGGGGGGAAGANNTGNGTASSGGGAGAGAFGGTGSNATANTGGGGGAGHSGTGTGGNGGSGVVILKSLSQATATTGSPVATTSGSYYIYQFNATGTITY